MALSLKGVLSISCIPDALYQSLKNNLMHMHCSFKSAIRKSEIALTTHDAHPLRTNTEGYASKTH
jgi:hypothetical protein